MVKALFAVILLPAAVAVWQDIEWRLAGICETEDQCYWAGFDGWNTSQWSYWICPKQLFGLYWLYVAD